MVAACCVVAPAASHNVSCSSIATVGWVAFGRYQFDLCWSEQVGRIYISAMTHVGFHVKMSTRMLV
jgi:hypothetical protein